MKISILFEHADALSILPIALDTVGLNDLCFIIAEWGNLYMSWIIVSNSVKPVAYIKKLFK